MSSIVDFIVGKPLFEPISFESVTVMNNAQLIPPRRASGCIMQAKANFTYRLDGQTETGNGLLPESTVQKTFLLKLTTKRAIENFRALSTGVDVSIRFSIQWFTRIQID